MQREYKEKLNITLDKEIKGYLRSKSIKEKRTISSIITEMVKDMIKEDKGGANG